MNVKDVMYNGWIDRGRTQVDYRVVMPDMRVVCTTKDLAKAERIAEQCGGTIHPSRDINPCDS
jgi:hypothetical protein